MRASPGPTADPGPPADPDAGFATWCAAAGVRAPHVAVCHTKASGRCAVATRPLGPGALVAAVPDDAVLTVAASRLGARLQAAGLGHAPGNAWREGVGLALALLGEAADDARAGGAASGGCTSRAADAHALCASASCASRACHHDHHDHRHRHPPASGSAWGGYVRWLAAADVDAHPATWPPAQAASLLAGTATLARLRGGRCRHAVAGLDRAWAVARSFIARNPSEFASPAGHRTTRPAFTRALATVAAYAFVLGDDAILGLVPWWDVLNHDATRAAKGHVSLSHCPRRGRLAMRVAPGVALDAGDEVLNSYGTLGGGELARRYGVAAALPEAVACSPLALGVAAVAAGLVTRPRLAARQASVAARGRKLLGLARPSKALRAAAHAAGAGRAGPATAAAVLYAVCERRRAALAAGARRAKRAADASWPHSQRRAAVAAAARKAEQAGVAALAAWAGAHL